MSNYFLVVLNPVANRRKAKNQWPEIKKQLDNLGLNYKLKISRHPLHLVSIVSHHLITNERINNLPNAIIVIGGDGTVHETIQGVRKAQEVDEGIVDIPIAIIPSGSNNNFFNHLKKEFNVKANIEDTMDDPKILMHDVGLFTEHIKKQKGLFLTNLGIGLDANVFSLKNNFRTHKINLKTRFQYYLSIIPTIYNLSTFPVVIKANEKKYELKKVFMVSATNNDATREIDLMVLKRKNIFQLFFVLMKVIFKHHLTVKSAFKIHSSNIRIEIPSLEYGHADGETLGSRFYDLEYYKFRYPFLV
ncbi:diacylglycerol/lipid kinase family protein [Apilactobacillus apinorum]|uniref:Diacylglycerol kinase family lipid kinase n=1 Tax=Apilactobacillus apinorum TaxID=1218495 RepID=A0ABP9ZGV1_9LACO|nr:diacylglycerol kinase family protein [Apilactobacillus apinorum]KOY69048.1 hypothetical protein RZ74_08500 [Apilactobacillus apinorum]CAI2681130.1 Hypothetical protein AAPFHON13_09010 [Apilactobacillus apinorum]